MAAARIIGVIGADDADRVRWRHRLAQSGTSALIPVTARPMISF